MKKILSIATMMLLAVCANAQVRASEPEFIGQVMLITSDSTGILLEKEQATMKAKSTHFGMIPIPGASLLDKTSTNMVIKGTVAKVCVPSGSIRLLLRVEKQDVDPSTFLRVIKFDVKKKTRESKLAETSLLQGFSTDFTSSSPYEVKKYGESSLLITLNNVSAGQYGISSTMCLDASTFGVE